jgi:hypothetical protein
MLRFAPRPDRSVLMPHFDGHEHTRAWCLPEGLGRVLCQMMVQLAKRLQSEISRRLAQEDFQAQSQRITSASKVQEDQSYLDLSAYGEAQRFALLRDQGLWCSH